MRTISRLLATLALAACSSGTTIIVRQPPPPPPPPRPRIEPLELALARPIRGHLLIQTNRPAYVAIFEIVPDRGVALLAPSYAHQRTWMLAGLNWVPVTWRVQSTMYYGPPSSHTVPGRWLYAIASDEPLHLPDAAFRPGYLQRVLGPAAYRSGNPYVTMRALSRAFVPAVVEEAWAEDAYALAATYASDPYRTVRIYCGNRTVYEVPEEFADRAWCPVSGSSTNSGTVVRSAPSRPDSVVATNGQRVRRRLPESRPVYRVREPARPQDGPVGGGDRTNTNANNNAGNNNSGGGVGNSGANANDVTKPVNDSARVRRGNGNAYGHTDDPNVRGRGIENEKQQRQTPAPPKEKAPNAEKETAPPQVGPGVRREPRVDPPSNGKPESQLVKPDRPAHVEEKPRKDEKPNDIRQEEKRAEKQEEKRVEKQEEKAPEAKEEKRPEKQEEKRVEKAVEKQADKAAEKAEEKPAPKPEAQTDGNGEAKGKPDNKPDAKEAKAEKPGLDGPNKKDQKGKP